MDEETNGLVNSGERGLFEYGLCGFFVHKRTSFLSLSLTIIESKSDVPRNKL